DLVPHQAYAAERAVQHRRLLLGGVDPHLVRRTHVRILLFLCLIGKRNEKVLSASRFGLSRLRRATPSGGRIPPRPDGRGLLRRAQWVVSCVPVGAWWTRCRRRWTVAGTGCPMVRCC